MTTVQKFVGGLVGIALITTLILPGRQTVPVINAITGGGKGLFSTVMGTSHT